MYIIGKENQGNYCVGSSLFSFYSLNIKKFA